VRFVIPLAALLLTCTPPPVYECAGWDKRDCLCPNGDKGEQSCSRGPAFSDPPPPRIWKHCSCCFDIRKDRHGVYYINEKEESGCWEDTYNPSLETFDTDTGNEGPNDSQ